MHLQLALVCDEARTTPEGKLDLLGVFNDLYAPGFPASQDRMVLVLVVEWDRGDEGRYTFRIDLNDPAGKPALTVEGHTEVDRRPLDRPPARTRMVLPIENAVFPSPGTYRFRVTLKGEAHSGPTLHLVRSGGD